MCDSKSEAEKAIREFDHIKESGLHLNKNKTQIISALKEMEGVEENEGVKVKKKLKYLGMISSCDRPSYFERR